MSRQTLTKRITVLERHATPGVSKELITRLAAEVGCTPEELLAEAEAIARQCQEAGAVTFAQQIQLIAGEHGITVEDVMADLEAMGFPEWR
jgi:hypothetical protein